MSDEQHEVILDEIAHCAALDHDEMPKNESDSNSDSPSSSSDDSDTDSDESSTDNKLKRECTVAAMVLVFSDCWPQYFLWSEKIFGHVRS